METQARRPRTARSRDDKKAEESSVRAGTDSTTERKQKSIRENPQPKPAQQEKPQPNRTTQSQETPQEERRKQHGKGKLSG
jgi:hypothetical protein